MTKQEYAQQIADQLKATERMMNKAAAEASKLMSKLVEAQIEFDVTDLEGEQALSHVGASLQSVTEAREAVIAAHKALAGMQDRHNVTVAQTLYEARAELVEAARQLRVVR